MINKADVPSLQHLITYTNQWCERVCYFFLFLPNFLWNFWIYINFFCCCCCQMVVLQYLFLHRSATTYFFHFEFFFFEKSRKLTLWLKQYGCVNGLLRMACHINCRGASVIKKATRNRLYCIYLPSIIKM